MLVIVEGGKQEYPEKNPRSRDDNQQQTQHDPHITPSPEIKPGPHWWEASALPLCHPCSHMGGEIRDNVVGETNNWLQTFHQLKERL